MRGTSRSVMAVLYQRPCELSSFHFRVDGNRKGHRDPPGRLRLRRLLCFSPAVWDELKKLAKGQFRSRQRGSRLPDPAPVVFEATAIPPDEGIQQDDRYAMGIELLNRPMPSWLWPRWEGVLDHQGSWQDPSPEWKLYLRKVFGRG